MTIDRSLVGKSGEPSSFTYTWKDAALYALSVGARASELDYLYEARGPKVLPSFAVIPTFRPMFERVAQSGADLAMIVHGSQRIEIHRPFAAEGTLSTVATMRAVYDMRKFASIVVDTVSTDEKNQPVCTTTWTTICRNEGGFGGEAPPKDANGIDVPKDASPTFRIEETTTPEQALLYRLNGDINPLHADPAFAKNVGFERGPILHGLCTYGHLLRHVAQGVCEGDAQRVNDFNAQFRRPVWPGDTLVTEGWLVAPGKVALTMKVKERDEVVIRGAWATFR